jgi:O-acetyl-ADP-ribose deacetylase (regulator of RNase III)
VKIVRGDLIELALAGQFDVIVHGCNCMCAMGAGIAKGIKATFPEAYAADCSTPKGAREKLGTISTARVERDGRVLHVVNGYTQYRWRGKKPLV